MLIITIAAQKGGAGKTTLAAHLGVQAATAGRKVLLADLDPQQSLTKWRKRREGFDLHLASMPPLDDLIATAQAEAYDLVAIDTPPRAAAATLDAIKIADIVLIPSQPSILDLDALDAMTELLDAAQARRRAHVVLNRCPPGRGIAPSGVVTDAAAIISKGHRLTLAPVHIGQRAAYQSALNDGRAVCEIEPGGKAAQEIADLYAYLMEHSQ